MMQITVKNGALRGMERGSVAAFLGIPFAKPPVGALRWRPPQPVEDWNGIRDAVQYGNGCVQRVPSPTGLELVKEPVSEDCLYLNVWTPKRALADKKKLPVLVIIHGGGFQAVSGAYDILQGWELAEQGIVVVTCNYRLGAFGFFAHPELTGESPMHASGNYGILDQIAALRWVQENIAAFGGDPRKVTVSGESAGAFSVSILCMSPLAKGLFCAATAQSGAFMDRRTAAYELYSMRQAEEYGAGLFPGMRLDELRRIPAQTLLERTNPTGMQWMKPVRDGYVFPMDARCAYERGAFCDVPLLIGSNRDDGAQFTSRSGEAQDLLRLARTVVPESRMREFRDVYPMATEAQTVRAQINFTGTAMFGHGMWTWAGLQSQYGKSPVFLYYDCLVPPGSALGSYHSSELVYLFRKLGYRDWGFTERDVQAERVLSGYLLNFVKKQDPNGDKLPRWDTFRDAPEKIMVWDAECRMEQNPTLAEMRFWDSIQKEERA